MFALGVAVYIFGYALVYTGLSNLLNGGNGPTLFESLGITGHLSSPADNKPAQGSGNQSGQAPSFGIKPPSVDPGIFGGPFQ